MEVAPLTEVPWTKAQVYDVVSPKRWFRIEALHVRNWNDASSGLHSGKVDCIDIARDDEIGATEDLDQIGNGSGRGAGAAIPEHLREAVNCFLLDLNARFWTFCFRELIGRPDPLFVSKSTFYHFGH